MAYWSQIKIPNYEQLVDVFLHLFPSRPEKSIDQFLKSLPLKFAGVLTEAVQLISRCWTSQEKFCAAPKRWQRWWWLWWWWKLINALCLCYKNDIFLAAGVMLAVSAGKRPFLLVLAVNTVTWWYMRSGMLLASGMSKVGQIEIITFKC